LYQQILQPGGLVHLKTDSPRLYNFTLTVLNLFELELLEHTDQAYAMVDVKPELTIKTHYEGLDIAQSNRVHYICFKINQPLPKEKDILLKTLFSEQEPS
jgi:tRNA (guanine-N7-)-methyltransferase